jgi:hypothetical protein
MAINQGDGSVIELEADDDSPLVPCRASHACLDLRGLKVSETLCQQLVLDKESYEAADHGLGNDPSVLVSWVSLSSINCVNSVR